jgi:uncharacterized membrane protein HdeD (DUF308 family)
MTVAGDIASQAEAGLHAAASNWGLYFAMGVVTVIVGILAIAYPNATIVTVAILFAAWLFVSGFVAIIVSFTVDGDTGFRILNALIGVLSVIVGFALLREPFQSVQVVIFVIGVFWVAQGIITLITAFSLRQGRGWAIFMGILGIIAGVIVLQYPMDSAVTLALIGGIWLIILGIMQIYSAWQVRSIAKATAPPTPAPPTPA